MKELAMRVSYPGSMTMRDARARYFDVNGFGPNGGYDDAWVDFSIGPVPLPFPNTKARVEAVAYHDLHHILTGYDTDFRGELEISAWEIAAGCGRYHAAWGLNLGGMAAGLFVAPRRTFAAFVRGRHDRTIYGAALEDVLALPVDEARARFLTASTAEPTIGDTALYAVATLVGLVVGLATLAIVLPLVPFGLAAHALRKRERAHEAG